MRSADYINNLWSNGGPFTGEEGKPHSRVYVQDPWDTDDIAVKDGDEDHIIHPTWTTSTGNYKSRGLPLRWYQKADNSQNMREVPNLKSVEIDRSNDNDAATCSITVSNQWMHNNGDVPVEQRAAGNQSLRGFFTPSRGQYPEEQVRWGHEANEWENVFTPNTILRTYQGYGGHSKSLEDCLTDGNLILTGVWLIDTVNLGSGGDLRIECRDMAKLLIDQQLYPPLVPAKKYPLTYYRYVYDNFRIKAAAKTVTSTSTVRVTRGDKRCVFRDSEVDRWYPQGATGSRISSGGFVLHGHQGRHAIDRNTGTYYLGVGNNGADRNFSVMWWEASCGEYIDAVYMHPWAGNYTMYISVMENGKWQGSSTIPYNESELYGGQSYVVDTGADIPYVKRYGVPWEKGQEYKLPRYYKAERVRITFRHLTYSGIGPWMYRGGIREVRLRSTQTTTVTTGTQSRTVAPFFWAADSLRDPSDLNRTGYVTCSQMGQIDAFGDCRVYAKTGGNDPTSADVYWIRLTSTGDGYWVLRKDGAVTCYGNAGYFGSPKDLGIGNTGGGDAIQGKWQFIAPTPTNQGYWCVAVDGRIRAFGDATNFASNLPGFVYGSNRYIAGGYSLKEGQGFYAVATNGVVYAMGAATHHGNWTGTADEALATCVPNMDGTGYWLMKSGGDIQAKGACSHFGEELTTSVDNPLEVFDQLMATASDDGYWILRGIGNIYAFGDAQFFGSPLPGSTGQIRRDGNYKDYADIIKDLAMWSGFLLFDEDLPDNAAPFVYGNIESTGSFSPEPLPDDLFDKKPPVDAMTALKEAVGYLLFVDDEGGLRFESPNFWSYGNWVQSTGQKVYEVPEIDERVNLFDYTASRNDESLRSLIIISSEDPNDAGDTTITTKIVPQTANGLKGLLKPAMWVNGWFQDAEEQKVMAELIALHIWFTQRLGQTTAVANPAIQINDQVRIYERTTAEVFLHYVRGIHTSHDLESGQYTMTLTTHWLGTGEDWAITDSPEYNESDDHFVISPHLVTWLKNQAGNDAEFSLGFPTTDPAFKAIDPMGVGGDDSTSKSGPEE